MALINMTIEDGELTPDEDALLQDTLAKTVRPSHPSLPPDKSPSIGRQAEESIGMAQTFSIVSALVEALGSLVDARVKKKEQAKELKERAEVEVGPSS